MLENKYSISEIFQVLSASIYVAEKYIYKLDKTKAIASLKYSNQIIVALIELFSHSEEAAEEEIDD